MIVALLDIMALLWNVLEHMPSGNLLRFATWKPIKRTVHNFLVVGSGKQTRISVSGHGVGSRTKYVDFFHGKARKGLLKWVISRICTVNCYPQTLAQTLGCHWCHQQLLEELCQCSDQISSDWTSLGVTELTSWPTSHFIAFLQLIHWWRKWSHQHFQLIMFRMYV